MTSPAGAAVTGMTRLPALDGLRAVAVVLVVLTHAAFLTGVDTTTSLLGRWFARGDFGVAIFFALSGFLLHRLLTREAARHAKLDLSGYAARRAARVLPAYWLVLVVVVAAVHPGLRSTLMHAAGIHIYVTDAPMSSFGQAWSIATEVSFYVALPFLVVGLERLRRGHPNGPLTLLILALAATSLLGLVVGPATIGSDLLLERWLPWRAPHFLIGMIFAEAVRTPLHPASLRLRSWADDAAGCLALAGAAYLVATTPIAGSLALEPTHGLVLVVRTATATAVAGALLLPLVLGSGESFWDRALSHSSSRWLGDISYGIFLWHLPVFHAVHALSGVPFFTGGMAPLLAVSLPISLLLGLLSHRLVELPGMRFAARVSRHRKDQPTQERQTDRAFQPTRFQRTWADESTSHSTHHDDREHAADSDSTRQPGASNQRDGSDEGSDRPCQDPCHGEGPAEDGQTGPRGRSTQPADPVHARPTLSAEG